MAESRTRRPRSSILDSLGEEIVRIIAPVSICMFLVVILVTILNNNSSFEATVSSIATIAYTETTSDSTWDKFVGSLLNSLAFVVFVTFATFILVVFFYFGCTRFLRFYMGLSAFVVLGFLGGEVSLSLIEHYSTPVDCITFSLVLFNFAVVGILAVFMSKMAIFVTQGYLVIIGMLVAYCFTMLPEWTTWAMLISMALYDLAAVLLPVGPLRLLVELAISRDEEIPALVYEARPVNHDNLEPRDRDTAAQRRVWRDPAERRVQPTVIQPDPRLLRNLVMAEDVLLRVPEEPYSELYRPLIDHGMNVQLGRAEDSTSNESLMLEGIGLGSTGAIKLGLGDFIFYSVLVGRAAMYDFMTVYACYLAIIAGLGVTLMLLAFYQKALPALPVSIALGVLFYFLTRLLLEVFVVQCSLNLLMF
ncbi:presenilin-like protein At2g29900 [Abrus precatorius]|uniref:Presenilin n=1 Tax=Abrus precatorius TaxID=3816 RepID=A0A8B8JQ17_ABRPR|nr:presenilin-like protein At2g29900 [Abrus precatorius]